MIEKRFSECRDVWIVSYKGDVQVFATEEMADEFIKERMIDYDTGRL